MKIALDAMGGDKAPFEPVKGAVASLETSPGLRVALVGKKELLEAELAKYRFDKDRMEIIDSREVILMDDEPISAVKNKKDSSMKRTLELVKEGYADAAVSAGNTGALIAASQLTLKRIRGVLRPAIAATFPQKKGGHMVVLDVGATADCKAEFLNQFAVMGSFYMEILFGIKNPKVGLLNIGAEEGKGNELTRDAYGLLSQNKKINFLGNIESTVFLDGVVDVVVTDGFTGNMVLKTSEGIAKFIHATLKKEMKWNPLTILGTILMIPFFKILKKKLDSSEYGGAMFLGLNGLSIKAHGNSDHVGIKNAIKVANKFAEMRFVEELRKVIGIQMEDRPAEEEE
ncbi:MAG: phosphate acyltransferase PlsX [Fusobacteriaceae bacterium]|jgi:glycerol-3-phosphate acyltransferase PlsX|nr:phosphate acyltransferase PlsX [Fusobacteriaceae bacterium]